MDKEVVILGTGITKFGRQTGRSSIELGYEAGKKALDYASISPKDVQLGFATHCNQVLGTGANMFNELGMPGLSVTNIEVACASHTRGVVLAAELVAAGMYDIIMVIGVERMPRGMVPMGNDSTDFNYEGRLGLVTATTYYALKLNYYMHKYGTKIEHIAKIAEKEHRNASLNPNATYREVYTLEQIMSARIIAEPITMLMCSANADGASATIICSKKKAKQFTTNAIRLVGWVHGGPPYVPGEPKIRESNLPELGRQLYKRAGIGPQDVGVFQCHNAFSPGELYHMEDLQLCPVGEGGPFIWEGNTEITGKIPINTDGGLVGRGHPLGATGGAMIAELIAQMRGQAGPRQIPTPPKVALCHNDGEGGSNVLMLTR